MAATFERHWKFYPALFAAIAFAAGILLARFADPTQPQLLILLFAVLGWAGWGVRSRNAYLLPAVTMIVLLSGSLLYTVRADRVGELLGGTIVQNIEMEARVLDDPIFRRNRIEYRVEVRAVRFRNTIAYWPQHVLVRIYDSSGFNPALLPVPGDRITVPGMLRIPGPAVNPGEPDPAGALRAQGVQAVLTVRSATQIHISRRDDLGWGERLGLAIRRTVHSFADEQVGGEEGDIVRALVLGEREYIDAETTALFSRAGVVHVLSVSGFHVAVLALAVFVLVSWLRGRWLQFGAFTIVMIAYTLLAGAGPAIVRATVMAVAMMLARTAGRVPRPLNTLGVGALVILFLDPTDLFDVGFQLSFAAVAGIVLFYGRAYALLGSMLGRWWQYSAVRASIGAVVLTGSAQVYTLPFVLHYFGYVPLAALAANLVVVPLYSLALGASLAGTLVVLLLPGIGGYFGGTAALALRAAGYVVEWGADLPVAGIQSTVIGWGGVAVIITALLYLAFSRSLPQALCRALIAVFVVAAVLVVERTADPLASQEGALLVLHANGDGLVPVVLLGTEATVYLHGRGVDSSAAAWMERGLQRRFNVAAVRRVNLDSVPIDAVPPDLLLLNHRPREYALRSMPVILSMSEARPLRVVRVSGDTLLQVPLELRAERALVLRFQGGWSCMEW